MTALSFEEQRQLSPEQAERYIAAVFARAEATCRRKEKGEEAALDWDYGRCGTYRNTRWGR